MAALHRYVARENRREKDLLFAVESVVPLGTEAILRGPRELWDAVDAMTTRKDGILGQELIASLPPPWELSDDLARLMVRTFARRIIVDPYGVPVTFGIHAPRGPAADYKADENGFWDGDGDDFSESFANGLLNEHVHFMIAGRELGPHGLSRRRSFGIDPEVRDGSVVDAPRWGELWAAFQNWFLAEHGSDQRTRLRPVASALTRDLTELREEREQLILMGATARELLADQTVELVNTEATSRAAGLLSLVGSPTTESVLRATLGRFHATTGASRIWSDVLESPALLRLGDGVTAEPSRWLTTHWAAAAETRAFSHGILLAAQDLPPVELLSDEGYSDATMAFVRAVFSRQALIFATSGPNPAAALHDAASLAAKAGVVMVSVSHGAGSIHPRAVIRTVVLLSRRPVSGALIVVDRADALNAADLDICFEAALAAGNRLLLIRRSDDPWWRPCELLEMIGESASAPLMVPGSGPISHHPTRPRGPVRRDQARFAPGSDAVDREALKLAAARNGPSTILVMDPARAARLERQLRDGHLATKVTSVLPEIIEGLVIALFEPGRDGGPMVGAQLARVDEFVIVADFGRTVDFDALCAQLRLDSPVQTAIAHAPFRDHLKEPLARNADAGFPRFVVDLNGNIVIGHSRVLRAIHEIAAAPLTLKWAKGHKAGPAELAGLLSILGTPEDGVVAPAGQTTPDADTEAVDRISLEDIEDDVGPILEEPSLEEGDSKEAEWDDDPDFTVDTG